MSLISANETIGTNNTPGNTWKARRHSWSNYVHLTQQKISVHSRLS